MSTVLILCAHRPQRSPSQRYRYEQYLPYLEANGFQFTFSYLLNEKDDKVFYSKGSLIKKLFILLKSIFIRFKDLRRFKDFDIIFIQREALFIGTSYFERKASLSGAHVIFDFDDSIWLADTSPGNKKWEWMKRPEKLFETFSSVQTVIAGNKFLEAKAKHYAKHVVLIPTSIDTSFHVAKPELRNKETLLIGWSGSISTVKHFELLIPVFLKLKEKFQNKIGFLLIGDSNYSHPILDIKSVPWSEETEVNLLNSIDIGVMALPLNEWSEGKCGLKGLSYMACGVPTIMTDIGVNSNIIQHGKNGYLAKTQDDWLSSLSLLIENAELRSQIGLNGRQSVNEKYSVESNKEMYLKVFREALKK